VLIASVKGEEGFNTNSGKIRTIFNIKYLLQLLVNEDNFFAVNEYKN
jgi:hypothetical protein